MLRELKIAMVAAALTGASFTANATVFTFDLFDSKAGQEADPGPDYGLRLDGLYSGEASDVYTFSFVDVTMKVDSVLNTARLFGDMKGGTAGNGKARDTDWTLDFTYTDLDVDGDGSWEFVNGSDGSGFIQSDLDKFWLVEHMGSDGFGPNGDGGPCRTSDGPWCGNGWLNHSIDPNLTLTEAGDNLNEHLAASDFLYTAVPVPEPGTLALLGLGIAGLSVARHRKA